MKEKPDTQSYDTRSSASGNVETLTPISRAPISISTPRPNSLSTPTPITQPPAHKRGQAGSGRLKLIITLSVLLVGALTVFFIVLAQRSNDSSAPKQSAAQPSEQYDIQKLDLGQLATSGSLGLSTSQSLSVNGQLRTNNSLVLAPTARPTSATTGQIYFDNDGGVIAYYNGAQFIDLAGSDDVAALQARIQQVQSGVQQVQSNVAQVQSSIPTVPSDIATLGGANTFSGQNTFNGGLTVGGGLNASSANLSGLSANTLSVSNAATLQGSLSVAGTTTLGPTTISTLLLNSPLGVSSGGTGATSLATNGVVIGQGTSALTTVSAAGANLCLMSTAGAPTFRACPGGVGSGVDSVNGESGTITINDATAAAGAITINDASTTAKGIARFNTNNFSVNAGVVNTAQNISVTAAPTFQSLTLTSPLATTSGGTGVSSLPSGSVVVGQGSAAFTGVSASAPGQCLISTAGAPIFQTCPGGASSSVESVNGLSGALVLNNATGSGTSVTINDASASGKGIASFNSTNFTVAGGAVNTVQNINTTAAPTFGGLTVGNVTSSGTFNGQTISSASNFTGSVSVNSGISAATGSFSGNVTAGGTLTANTIAASAAQTIGSTTQSLTLQGSSTSLSSTNGANKTTLSFVSPTANVTYRLQTASAGTYDICTTAGNCAGVGGGVTTVGGTTGYLARFSNSQGIVNSSITDDGSVVGITGSLQANTITPTAAMTIGSAGQGLTLQGNGATTVSATAGGIKNTLAFTTPSGTNKTITLPNASGVVAVSASGPLSIDANGNITCASCVTSGGSSGGSSAVDSLNGRIGALTLSNATGSGTTITINDASTSAKGIASFNATNFTATGGVINTAQNLNTTAAPTFGSLTVNGAVAATGAITGSTLNGATISGGSLNGTQVNGLGISSTAITSGGALSVTAGGTNQNVTLQGSGSGQVIVQTPSFKNANGATYAFNAADASSVNATICTTLGNCTGASGGGVISNGTAGYLARYGSDGYHLENSLLSQSGTTLTMTGTLAATALQGDGVGVTNVNAVQLNGQAASYYLNASNLASGTVADARLSSNAALYNRTTSNFTGTLQQAGNAVCTTANNCGYLTGASADGNYVQLQVATPGTAQTGNLNITGAAIAASFTGSGAGLTGVNASQLNSQPASYYLNASNIASGTLADARLSTNAALYNRTTSNFTGTLQQGGNNVCTTAGNCVGSGGSSGVGGSGTAGTVAVFTGSGYTVGNSLLSQAATTVTVDGTLAATALQGEGSGVTNVNAVQLNGQAASYYLNASNIGSGTLADARLSANTALYNRTTSNFTGTLQQAGNTVCDASNNCGYLTSGGASGNYVQLQSTTPGTAQTGNLNITGTAIAANFTGNGANVTNVNATQLNSQAASYYLNATNLGSGTLADARLSTNVALLTGAQSFTGVKTFSAAGTALQVTNNASIGGTLTLGAGGLAVNNGTANVAVLAGASGAVTLQNVTITPNSTVKVGTGMGILFTDGTGTLQSLAVTGQDGNCVGYNGTTVTFQGCSGSGGGITTEFANGGNSFTGSNGSTATTRIGTSYDAAITNPVLGLSSNSALDIVTNNSSRINIQAGGDVSVLSNSGNTTSKFAVRTQNTGDSSQYINALVVDTTSNGRVGIGLTVGTAPQVSLDIGGGVNNYGGSGIQVRASSAPGASTSGSSGAGSASTGRIYYDQVDRKFKVSENGGAYVDLVVSGGGTSPILQGGNNSSAATVVIGNKYANGNGGLIVGTANNNGTISTGMHVDSSGNYLFDKPYNDNDQYGFRINGSGGNSALHVDTRYNVVSIGGLTTSSTSSYGSLVVGGNGIMSTGGFRVGTGSEDVGITLSCSSSQQTIDAPQFKNGILVKSNGCRANNSDLAEAYNSSDNIVAGELVMATTESATSVKRATAAGADTLMGIVSTEPSQTLGTAQVPNGHPIALSGRVPTKVNTEGGIINVGDKITISSVPGVGKKATGAGMIVGTAVEAFSGTGIGSIEVFVNLTYYSPSSQELLQASSANFGALNISGETTLNHLSVQSVNVSGNLTVTGLTTVQTISVNGHIITSSGQPTSQSSAANGGGSVSVSGTDTAGTITVTTGAAPSAGELAKLVFSAQYTATPRIVISASNAAASDLRYYKGGVSISEFGLSTSSPPAPNTTYTFDYFIAQ